MDIYFSSRKKVSIDTTCGFCGRDSLNVRVYNKKAFLDAEMNFFVYELSGKYTCDSCAKYFKNIETKTFITMRDMFVDKKIYQKHRLEFYRELVSLDKCIESTLKPRKWEELSKDYYKTNGWIRMCSNLIEKFRRDADIYDMRS